jgi:hypothetical protein
MVSYSRLILQVAATTGIAMMLSTAAPAVAAEAPVPARETVATASTVPHMIKRHASRAHRIAASLHHDRRVVQTQSHLDCYGVWCGRQFVLMVGIGY